MSIEDLILRATAWASLLAWTASEWLKSTAVAVSVRGTRARAFSTAGVLALCAHSALAFHTRYGWSHEAARRETARQTEAVTGLAFGGGLYVNEVFLIVWFVEVLWWWRAAARYRSRGRALEWPVRAFFLLMFVSGAIVFAHGPVRLAGIAAVLAVAWAWYRGANGDRRSGAQREVAHG